MDSLTREEVRGIDHHAIEMLEIPGLVLMENAGRSVADAVEDILGGAAGRSVAIVCGVGNNGGDGFVVARHLAIRGANVTTFIISPQEKITSDASVNLDILRKLGHEIRHAASDESLENLAESLRAFDLIVDAVGGTGIRGALRGELALAVEQINAAGGDVIAVDIPTGLDCDTGEAPGEVVRAKLTITFVARKKGFDAPGAAEFTGQVRVTDIGIPPDIVARIATDS